MRQTKNVEAEHRCCEIGLRAERKAGELLQQTERAKGGRPASYDLDYKNQSIDTSGFDTPSREMGSPKPLIDPSISTSAAINHRNGRNWPVSRWRNLRPRWRHQRNRRPPASSRPHRRLDQTPYPPKPCGCGTRRGKSAMAVSTLIPNGRARPSAQRESRPAIRTTLHRGPPPPP